MRPLILASVSPQRRVLLKRLRVPFRIVASRACERCVERVPGRLVSKLALRKAKSVASLHPDALVLGADTVVSCGGKILLKPKDSRDALRMVSALNGRWHRVYTGVALVEACTGRSWTEVAVSRVKARALPPGALKRLAGKHNDKAGGYAVQDHEDPFIDRVVGPLDNVIGLPLGSVRRLLRNARRPASSGGKAARRLSADARGA